VILERDNLRSESALSPRPAAAYADSRSSVAQPINPMDASIRCARACKGACKDCVCAENCPRVQRARDFDLVGGQKSSGPPIEGKNRS
jgi:hypothetical protein